MRFALPALLLITSINDLRAQHQVPAELRYHRLICVVPVAGTGKTDDPVRPQFAELLKQNSRANIFEYSFQLTDDKNFAIVEFVAADRQAFASILADKNPKMRVFERGKNSKEEIETELRKWKKDVDMTKLGVQAR